MESPQPVLSREMLIMGGTILAFGAIALKTNDITALRRRSMTLAPAPAAFLHLDPAVDEDLARRVRLFLGTRNLAALRRFRIQARNGEVTIEGAVRSYYERQLAIAGAKRVAGVRQVIDMILVETQS